MMPPLLGLRVEYNPELRKRDEWARLAPTLTTLGSFKGAPWDAWNADFSIELVYERQMLQAFDTHNHTHLLKRNALLLTPTRLDVHNRHQTAVTIRKFTEANRSSLGVIIYLMDTAVLGNEQINAVQSLGALHHYLSMGFAEPPQVLVVSDPSYLLDCISAYMKGISRANPTTVKIAGGKPLLFDTPGPSPFVSTIKDKQ
ncbi:hypothetical protein N7457_006351 [Penicillium paradoxum]|uniref:uncharacterized protein n=1 Tax=Penicillium paradoxum TaxID=176176 RepID=UPI002548BB42|nr:uncharacterized protein N7457_006351 [Penicillium paradoxum]KAJ5781191.1 hypothetical protein N7457_006351 [Penicillium paradoxum]